MGNRFEIVTGQLAQALVNHLQGLSGEAFDKAWRRAQLAGRGDALLLHLRAAIRGENDAIRTLAQNALPVITKHVGELIDLAKQQPVDRDRERS
jgi:predicted outer membrane protein